VVILVFPWPIFIHSKIVLTNVEIIDLVNLKLISEYHHIPPEDVIKMRAGGKHFVVIHDEIKKGKGKEKEPKEIGKEYKEKGEGKGRGKGKNK